MQRPLIASVCALLASACAAPRPLQPGPRPSIEAKASARPAVVVPEAAPTPREPEWTAPRDADATPLRALLERSCTEPFEELEAAYARSDDVDRRAILERVLRDPPEMPAPQLAFCAPRLRAYVASLPPELDREALAGLRRITRAMTVTYERDASDLPPGAKPFTLCPAAPPVPPRIPADGARLRGVDVGESPSNPPPARPRRPREDGWRCMHLEQTGDLAFQYEVVVDRARGTFRAIARRRVGATTIELSVDGKVTPDKRHVVLASPVETRR